MKRTRLEEQFIKNQVFIVNKTASNFGALKDFEKLLNDKESNDYLERCYGEKAWKASAALNEAHHQDQKENKTTNTRAQKKAVAGLKESKYELNDDEEMPPLNARKPHHIGMKSSAVPLDESGDSSRSPEKSDDSMHQSDDDRPKNNRQANLLPENQEYGIQSNSSNSSNGRNRAQGRASGMKRQKSYDSMAEDSNSSSQMTPSSKKMKKSIEPQEPDFFKRTSTSQKPQEPVYNFSSAAPNNKPNQYQFSIPLPFFFSWKLALNYC